MSKLWGGRFDKETDPLFRALNDSLRFDYRLIQQDIAGSIAWAGAIARAGVLGEQELEMLVSTLREIERTSPAPEEGPPEGARDEDVHAYVESRLVSKVGPLGKKLHTGRSRNDQVATDLRLWVRDAIDARREELREAQRSLLALAERAGVLIIPGYTHLQRAQPVLMAHWCLAYFEMLERDVSRLSDARRRANLCPLGSAALAGTTFAVDRVQLARELGFDGPTANSLDGVSDRDFVIETLAAATMCAVHLSRLAEDLIIYTTEEFGFIELDDSVTSGSSLMPQKKNPDACELLRGKVGRILGALVALLTVNKGLPLSYNKDLQEDKEPLFDAMDNLSLCLRVLPRILDGAMFKGDRCRTAAMGGYSNATDLADYLVEKGVPFRDAHEITGKIVRAAIEKVLPIERMALADLQKFSAEIGGDVFERLTPEAVVARRNVPGGTAPNRVREALAEARRRLDAGV